MSEENPYELSEGFETRHDYPIVGYGVTTESIAHWLFDNQLPVEEIGYQKVTGESLDDAYETDFDTFIENSNQGTTINYVTTSTAGESAIICYSFIPQPYPKTIPTSDEVNADIVKAIEALYNVPTDKHDELSAFVAKYAGYIGICDYS